ncbi:30S ribosomal protein S14 [Candidatus Pacearchaeota archaeon]|nr:30S ribosomal protein S14 [Candidatus Pacearchaeota archaeon]
MTASDWRKVLKQLSRKPAKRDKWLKHNKPQEKTCGIAQKKCEKCGRFGAMVGQYGINLCRQCFRDIAEDLGFKKYS